MPLERLVMPSNIVRNLEREFIKAIEEKIQGLFFQLYDGSREALVGIAVGKFPERIPGYPFLLITPMGPSWQTDLLGGGNRGRRTKIVNVTLELHYEASDAEIGIYRMSDIFTQTVEFLLSQPKILDEELLDIIDTDYAYSINDRESYDSDGADTVPEWGYKGVAVISLQASWRFPKQ